MPNSILLLYFALVRWTQGSKEKKRIKESHNLLRAAIFRDPGSVEIGARPDPVIHAPTDAVVRRSGLRLRIRPLVLLGRHVARLEATGRTADDRLRPTPGAPASGGRLRRHRHHRGTRRSGSLPALHPRPLARRARRADQPRPTP